MSTPNPTSVTPTTTPLKHTISNHAATLSKYLLRTAKSHIRNTRISPLATYLAYKASGLSESGHASGLSVSDFVAVWSPYDSGGGTKTKGMTGKGGGGKAMGKAMGLLPAGTKITTAERVMEKHGREGRPMRQSVAFGRRRRHFCRQEGCERCEV